MKINKILIERISIDTYGKKDFYDAVKWISENDYIYESTVEHDTTISKNVTNTIFASKVLKETPIRKK